MRISLTVLSIITDPSRSYLVGNIFGYNKGAAEITANNTCFSFIYDILIEIKLSNGTGRIILQSGNFQSFIIKCNVNYSVKAGKFISINILHFTGYRNLR